MKKSVLPIALGGAALLGILFLSGNASAKGGASGGTFTPPDTPPGRGEEDNPIFNDPSGGPAIVPRGRSPLGRDEDTLEPSAENDERIRRMAASLMTALLDCYEFGEIPALSTSPGFGGNYTRGAGPKNATERALALSQTFQCALRWAQTNFDFDAIREAGLDDAFSELLSDTTIVFANWVLYGASTYPGVSNGEALYSGTVIGKSFRNIVYNYVTADVVDIVLSKFR